VAGTRCTSADRMGEVVVAVGGSRAGNGTWRRR